MNRKTLLALLVAVLLPSTSLLATTCDISISGLPSSATYGSTYSSIKVTFTYTWTSTFDKPNLGAEILLFEDDITTLDADEYKLITLPAPPNGSSSSGTWSTNVTFNSIALADVGGGDDSDDVLEIRARVTPMTDTWDDENWYSDITSKNAVPATPSSCTVPSTDADGSYSVSWSSSAGADSYELQEKVDSGSWSTVSTSGSPWTTPSARAGGHTYYYQVRGVNSSSSSGWRAGSNGCTVPQPNRAPNTPSSEDPSNGATGISISADLDWSCTDPDDDTIYYTVYFEKNDSSPDVAIKTDATGSSASLPTLEYSSHYYWQVKADDHKGGVTLGPVWDFYTESEPTAPKAINPTPLNSIISVQINPTLQWQSGGGTTATYDIYFGTDSTPDSGEFIRNQSGTSFTTNGLQTGTTYYWRIDAKNSGSGTTTGDTWSFTTCGNSGPGPDRGNTTGHEYGDAIYRLLSSIWIPEYNHAGLCAGIDGNGVERTFESLNTNEPADPNDTPNEGPQEGRFVENWLNAGVDYYGAYIPATYSSTMPFDKRQAIVAKARELVDNAVISYPELGEDAIELLPGWTAPVAIDEINQVRCDGLVEYSYESAGVRVWRNCLVPSNEWSIVDYPLHSNVNPDYTRDPHFEQTPWAQRGAPPATGPGPGSYSGPPWPDTTMTKPSPTNLPTVSRFVVDVTDTYADIILSATDESGIYQIIHNKPDGAGADVSVKNPDRHPSTDTYNTSVIRVYNLGVNPRIFSARAQDHGGNMGNWSSWDILFKPPKPTNPIPSDGATGRPITQTLSWDDVAAATSYDVYFGTSDPPPLKGNQTDTTYNPALVNDIRYYWRIDAKNSSGTTQGDVWWFRTIAATPDTTPPTVTITSPSNGETFLTQSITISGTASDPGSPSTGVALVQVRVNGGSWETASGTTSWSAPVSLVSGPNTIEARSKDGADNYSTIASVSVTYTPPPDTTPPVIAITTPTSNSTYSTSTAMIDLGGTASDNNVTVTQVTWSNSRGGSGTASGTDAWSVSGITLYSGDNVITVTAYDAAANTGTDVITVTYTPVSAPAIAFSPGSLTRSVTQGQNAASQTFQVWNLGSGTMDYTVSTNVPWLSVSPTNGVSSGATNVHTVCYSTASLAPGTYNGTITMTSTNASNSPQPISVTLNVSGSTINDGLVAWYKLDGDALDSSGNDHDGENNGATPTTDRFGNTSGAMLFNGTSYINLDAARPLRGTQSVFTVSAWIHPTTNSLGQIFMHRADSHDLILYWENYIRWWLEDGYGDHILDSAALDTNRWWHIAGIYNGSVQQLYINGFLVASTDWVGYIDWDAGGPPAEGIGGMSRSDSCRFMGAIDDVRIYNRALTASEVYELAGGLNAGLVAWWRMQDKSGDTIRDASGNGHTATINGSPTFAFSSEIGRQYVRFNGSSYLSVEDADDLDLTNNWTISVWAKLGGFTGGWEVLASKRRDGYDLEGGWSFIHEDPVSATLTVHDPPTKAIRATIDTNIWNHVAVAFVASNSEASIYVNGDLCTNAVLHSVIANDHPVFLGATLASGGNPSKYSLGALADVRVYGRALSGAEVQALVNAGSSTALGIATISPLPSGTVGISYSQALVATGGTPTYTWSVVSSSLPAGLTLVGNSGAITGTPTVAATMSFTIQVTDSNALSATQQFSLTIDTAYVTWQVGHFTAGELLDPSISGDTADPDHDGIPNLMEYALNLNPKVANVTGLPTTTLTDGYLTLTYRQNKQATDISYLVEACGVLNINSWSTDGLVTISTVDSDTCWSVTVRDAVPMSSATNRFMRLKVNKP